jgi:hypothetical protein
LSPALPEFFRELRDSMTDKIQEWYGELAGTMLTTSQLSGDE